MPGTVGNTNSSKSNRLWGDTIRRAIAQSDADRLRKIAEALLTKAEEGDMAAIKELGDRLDGKPAQTLSGDPENPLVFQQIRRLVVDPKP